jgi:hypothetical protein
MGVKRFDFVQDAERHDSWMEEAAHGEYVKASDYDALQAKLDQTMLEFCPQEMTPEQRYNWENAQRSAGSGDGKHGT